MDLLFQLLLKDFFYTFKLMCLPEVICGKKKTKKHKTQNILFSTDLGETIKRRNEANIVAERSKCSVNIVLEFILRK